MSAQESPGKISDETLSSANTQKTESEGIKVINLLLKWQVVEIISLWSLVSRQDRGEIKRADHGEKVERGGQGKEGQGGRDGAGRGRSTVSTAWPVHLEEARPCPGQCPPPPGTPSAMPRQPARCLEGGRRGAGDSPPPPGRSLLRGSAPSLGSAPAPHVELCVPHLCSARSSPPACRKGQRKRETPLFRRHTFLYSSPPCTDMHVLSAWKRVVQKHLGPKGRFSDNRRVFVHCETNSSISWSVCLLTKP